LPATWASAAFLLRADSQGDGVSVIDVEGADLDLPVGLATPIDLPQSAATTALNGHIVRAAGTRKPT
jgi:hypothetical protein